MDGGNSCAWPRTRRRSSGRRRSPGRPPAAAAAAPGTSRAWCRRPSARPLPLQAPSIATGQDLPEPATSTSNSPEATLVLAGYRALPGQQSLLPRRGRRLRRPIPKLRLGGAVRQRAACEFDRFAAETGTLRPPQRARLLRRRLRGQHQGPEVARHHPPGPADPGQSRPSRRGRRRPAGRRRRRLHDPDARRACCATGRARPASTCRAPGHYAVAMCFLPQDEKARAFAVKRLEHFIKVEGQTLVGWRDVPTDTDRPRRPPSSSACR